MTQECTQIGFRLTKVPLVTNTQKPVYVLLHSSIFSDKQYSLLA